MVAPAFSVSCPRSCKDILLYKTVYLNYSDWINYVNICSTCLSYIHTHICEGLLGLNLNAKLNYKTVSIPFSCYLTFSRETDYQIITMIIYMITVIVILSIVTCDISLSIVSRLKLIADILYKLIFQCIFTSVHDSHI